jgi:acetyl-CoA carboxylase carboxyltransferase component
MVSSRVKLQSPCIEDEKMYTGNRRNEQYDMMEIINRLVDNSEFEAYKDGYDRPL